MASQSESKADQLAQLIEELKQEREQHVEAIERIDATAAQYGIDLEAISGSGSRKKAARRGSKKATKKKAARKKAAKKSAAKKSSKKASGKKGARKKRGRFSQTGSASVLAFVKQHGGPTAAEVNQQWHKEGRGGTADNTLSQLVKGGYLKRVQIKGETKRRYKTTQ
jgi:hypothetical protein